VIRDDHPSPLVVIIKEEEAIDIIIA